MKCLWCGRELSFKQGKGWVHAENGKLYWSLPDGSGDDHCALPDVRDEVPDVYFALSCWRYQVS